MATTRESRRRPAIRPSPALAASRVRSLLAPALLLLFAVLYGFLEWHAAAGKSATWDESIHLTAGYVALADRDYRVDPSHPPFLRMWAALPLLAARPAADPSVIDRTPVPVWLDAAYAFAHRFMYVDNDADRLLQPARAMAVIWGVLLGILLFCWAREWLGLAAGALALVLYTVEPNLSAHASLVTTDFGVTCFIFGAVYFLWRTSRRADAFNVAGLTAFVALAVISKFSGLILAPLVAALLALAVHRRMLTPRTAGALAALLAAAAFVAIWAAYGFRYAPSGSPGWLLRAGDMPQPRDGAGALAAPLLGWIDAHHLLPNAFSQGLLFQAVMGSRPAFLAGARSAGGWWYYFPVAFLIKTPLAILALLAGGLVVFARRRPQAGTVNLAFVLGPIALYLGVAMASRLNIGLRHILPIYPFVLLAAAAAAAELLASRRLPARLGLAAIVALSLAEFGSVYPDTLAFFNRLVGGPKNGYRYLADSNVDWGQDLKGLKRWMDVHGVRHVNLAYFGTADPAYYGIDSTPLAGAPFFQQPARPQLPGYVAISDTVLSGVYLEPRWRLFYRGFRTLEPAADIGHSIRVYWVDRWPQSPLPQGADNSPPPDLQARRNLAAALFSQRWFSQALVHDREYLKYRPRDVEALTRAGVSLASLGRPGEAIRTFRQAVAVAPGSETAQLNLGLALFNADRVQEASGPAREAVRLAPGDAGAHDLLGRVLALQGRLSEALDHLEQSVQLDPTNPHAREHLRLVRQAMQN